MRQRKWLVFEWRIIKGFNGFYRVSNYGDIESCRKKSGRVPDVKGPWRPLKPNVHKSGHCVVMLRKKGKTYPRYVHHLVLEAFVGPCPKGFETCHSPDRNPRNNRLDNIRWDTRKANKQDSIQHGTHAIGSKQGAALLTEADIPIIRRRLINGETQPDIAADYGVSRAVIGNIKTGYSWSHV